MYKKNIKYAGIVCIVYIIAVGFLGFAVRDDFLALTFPSWPLLINCSENCGYKMIIALLANGMLVGALAFAVFSIVFFFLSLAGKRGRSVINNNKR